MKHNTPRAIGALLALVLILAGCAVSRRPAPAIPAYGGPTRPADQVAIFNCGFGVTLRAIDGNRNYNGNPLACRYSLLPGRHRFRVAFTAETGGDAKRVSSPHDYIVRLDLVAGRKYTLNAFLKDDRNAAMPWKVNLGDSSEKYLIDVKNVREVR